MRRHTLLYSIAALTLILALGGTSHIVGAALLDASHGQTLDNGSTHGSKGSNEAPDGLEQLPLGMQSLSYNRLVLMGVIKPVKLNVKMDPNAKFQPRDGSFAPLVTWDAERNASGLSVSNEPDATLHPTDPFYALVSGNISLDTTTNGGVTWQDNYPPWGSTTVDVVQAYAPASPGQDTAIAAGLVNCNPGPCTLNAGRSTDRGITWQTFSPVGMNSTGYDNDRPDLWSDNDPSSPFYGRMYLTKTLRDPELTGSFNTVTTQYSEDNGQSWSEVFMHDNPYTYFTDGPKQFGSMGFGPNGTVYVGWFATRCCVTYPPYGPPINVPNKLRWARSDDGGVTFPISGTAIMDDLNRSPVFNHRYSPAGFQWNAQPDIGVDPVDGTMYMTWLRFRRDNPPSGAGAAVHIISSTDQGATWSVPIPVYNDPDPDATHYMPWVEVSRDHKVHVTYTSDVGGSRTTLAHFYVQSADQGRTWSTPFQLSGTTYPPTFSMGDYQQAEVVSYGNTGKIIASWTDNRSGSTRHYARIGTFALNTCESSPEHYAIQEGAGTITSVGPSDKVPGSMCDDCTVAINVPFTFELYPQSNGPNSPNNPASSNTTVYASSNGNLQFVSSDPRRLGPECPFPVETISNKAIYAYWGDLDTAKFAEGGIYTQSQGSPPNRTFSIVWEACQKDPKKGAATNTQLSRYASMKA